jgi:hypothetical protein
LFLQMCSQWLESMAWDPQRQLALSFEGIIFVVVFVIVIVVIIIIVLIIIIVVVVVVVNGN